jgi:hypothetical protein
MYGTGTCSEYKGTATGPDDVCSNHGNCVEGLCNCSVGYKGLSCELTVLCSYFDTNASEWSTRGCSVVASPPGYTYCECYHLTDFGGIGIPTSAEDLLAEIEGIPDIIERNKKAEQLLTTIFLKNCARQCPTDNCG